MVAPLEITLRFIATLVRRCESSRGLHRDGTSLLAEGSHTGIRFWDTTTGLMRREIKTA
jgi:hypothetical protein